MRLKSEPKGRWLLIDAKDGTRLHSVTITFPEGTTHAGGVTTYHIAGPPRATITVRNPDGSSDTVEVDVEW